MHHAVRKISKALVLGLAVSVPGLSQTPAAGSADSEPSAAPEPAATPAPTPKKPPVKLDKSFRIPQDKAHGPGVHAGGPITHTPGVVFTPDGRRMVTATNKNEIVVFDAKTREIIRSIRIPGKASDAVSIDPEGRYAAWVLEKKGVVVVDLETGAVAVRDDDLVARWIAVGPGGKRLALSRGKVLEIRDLQSLKILSTLPGHEAEVTNLCWSADGKRLASTAQNGRLLVHDVATKEVLRRIDKGKALHAVAFHPEGRLVAYGGLDKKIYQCDVESGKEEVVSKKNSQPYWITCLGYSPDGRRLAVGDESCDIWIYELPANEMVFHNKHHVECWLGSVAWSGDNETFLFGCRPNSHAGKPALYQALTRAEAAQSATVRRSRAKLLEIVKVEIQKTEDAGAKKKLVAFRERLESEEEAHGPGIFGAQNVPQALNLLSPAGSQLQVVDGLSSTLALKELPESMRELAGEHEKLVQREMKTLQSDFCINQWKVRKK